MPAAAEDPPAPAGAACRPPLPPLFPAPPPRGPPEPAAPRPASREDGGAAASLVVPASGRLPEGSEASRCAPESRPATHAPFVQLAATPPKFGAWGVSELQPPLSPKLQAAPSRSTTFMEDTARCRDSRVDCMSSIGCTGPHKEFPAPEPSAQGNRKLWRSGNFITTPTLQGSPALPRASILQHARIAMDR